MPVWACTSLNVVVPFLSMVVSTSCEVLCLLVCVCREYALIVTRNVLWNDYVNYNYLCYRIHVRRTDKRTEARYHDLQEYMTHVMSSYNSVANVIAYVLFLYIHVCYGIQ